MTNRTRKWLRTGVEYLLHGFWAAVIASGIAFWIDQKDWALWSNHFFKMFGGVFFLQGGARAFQFYANNPLPPDSDTTPPIPAPQPMISVNPLSKVQPLTTFEEPPKP